MTKESKAETAVEQLFNYSDFSIEDLVRFAEEGHGFCGDNGYHSLTYPSDRDEYEVVHEGANEIPDGKVEIGYWTGDHSDVLVDLDWYLNQLEQHLSKKGKEELRERISNVRKSR